MTAHQVTWGVGVECDSTSTHLGGGGGGVGVECDSTSSHLGGGGWSVTEHQVTWGVGGGV